ncbi:hypothetical protein HK104_005617, partial [Borealophlyctis nickersoniae]
AGSRDKEMKELPGDTRVVDPKAGDTVVDPNVKNPLADPPIDLANPQKTLEDSYHVSDAERNVPILRDDEQPQLIISLLRHRTPPEREMQSSGQEPTQVRGRQGR